MLTIENAGIFLGENLEYVESGYIEIENGRIRSAGAGKSQSRGKKLDGTGFIVMPGFINAHIHIADSIGKDIAAGKRLDARVHPVLAGNHHPQRAVSIHDAYPLDRDLAEVRRGRLLAECGGCQHDEHERGHDGVSAACYSGRYCSPAGPSIAPAGSAGAARDVWAPPASSS